MSAQLHKIVISQSLTWVWHLDLDFYKQMQNRVKYTSIPSLLSECWGTIHVSILVRYLQQIREYSYKEDPSTIGGQGNTLCNSPKHFHEEETCKYTNKNTQNPENKQNNQIQTQWRFTRTLGGVVSGIQWFMYRGWTGWDSRLIQYELRLVHDYFNLWPRLENGQEQQR